MGNIAQQLARLAGKPDYSHITKDQKVSLDISASEMAAVLWAYDRGLETLDEEAKLELERVINKLKDVLWP